MSCLGAFIAKPQYKITKISKEKTIPGGQNGKQTKKVTKKSKSQSSMNSGKGKAISQVAKILQCSENLQPVKIL